MSRTQPEIVLQKYRNTGTSCNTVEYAPGVLYVEVNMTFNLCNEKVLIFDSHAATPNAIGSTS